MVGGQYRLQGGYYSGWHTSQAAGVHLDNEKHSMQITIHARPCTHDTWPQNVGSLSISPMLLKSP